MLIRDYYTASIFKIYLTSYCWYFIFTSHWSPQPCRQNKPYGAQVNALQKVSSKDSRTRPRYSFLIAVIGEGGSRDKDRAYDQFAVYHYRNNKSANNRSNWSNYSHHRAVYMHVTLHGISSNLSALIIDRLMNNDSNLQRDLFANYSRN